MPFAARSQCIEPGCVALASVGQPRCPAHTVERVDLLRQRDQARGSADARGYDRTWRRVRRAFLGLHPFCRLCDERGVVELAAEVDHIVPIRTAPERRLDWSNLQSLCTPCHSAKTAREDGGFGRGRGGRKVEAEAPKTVPLTTQEHSAVFRQGGV